MEGKIHKEIARTQAAETVGQLVPCPVFHVSSLYAPVGCAYSDLGPLCYCCYCFVIVVASIILFCSILFK